MSNKELLIEKFKELENNKVVLDELKFKSKEIQKEIYETELKEIKFALDRLRNTNLSFNRNNILGDEVKLSIAMYLSRLMNLSKTEFKEIKFRHKLYYQSHDDIYTLYLGMGDFWEKKYERRGRIKTYNFFDSYIKNPNFIKAILEFIPDDDDKKDTEKVLLYFSTIKENNGMSYEKNNINKCIDTYSFYNDYNNLISEKDNIKIDNIRIFNDMVYIDYNNNSDEIKLNSDYFSHLSERVFIDGNVFILLEIKDEIINFIDESINKFNQDNKEIEESREFSNSKLSPYLALLGI